MAQKRLTKWQRELAKLNIEEHSRIEKELKRLYAENLKNLRRKLREYSAKPDLKYWEQMRIGSLAKLEQEITELLLESGVDVENKVFEFIDANLERGYDELFYQTEQELGQHITFNQMNKRTLAAQASNPIDYQRLSKRLHDNREQLAKQTQHVLNLGTQQGWGYRKMAKEITKASNMDYNKALRIARTEGTKAYGLGKIESFKEAERIGIQGKKRWVATLDNRTRSTHQHLDGVEVGFNEEFITNDGDRGMAPGDFSRASNTINCRCAVVTVVEGYEPKYRRDGLTKERIQYKNYNDWKVNRGDD